MVMAMLGTRSGDALLALPFEVAGGVYAGTVSAVRHRDSSTRVRLGKGACRWLGFDFVQCVQGFGCSGRDGIEHPYIRSHN